MMHLFYGTIEDFSDIKVLRDNHEIFLHLLIPDLGILRSEYTLDSSNDKMKTLKSMSIFSINVTYRPNNNIPV